jgi:hypothetical protein
MTASGQFHFELPASVESEPETSLRERERLLRAVFCRDLVHAFPIEDSIEFGAQQHAERTDVKPDQGGDAGGERAVDAGIVGDARDIKTVGQRGRKPDERARRGAGQHPEPMLPAPGAEVIERGEDGEDGGDGDGQRTMRQKKMTT